MMQRKMSVQLDRDSIFQRRYSVPATWAEEMNNRKGEPVYVVEKPTALINIVENEDEDRMYTVGDEARKVLNDLLVPIVVVGISGWYSTGKSSLLNCLIGKNAGGFPVGENCEPCTAGMWLWGAPIRTTMPDGQEVAVLFVDCEGLGATHNTETIDAQMFSLILLLSSHILFNSGKMEDTWPEHLSALSNLHELIKVFEEENGSSESDESVFASIMPRFIWVLRDYSVFNSGKGKQMISSPEGILADLLRLRPEENRHVAQENKVRQALSKFFKERMCATLPNRNMGPQFEEAVGDFRKKIISDAAPKAWFGQQLNGPMLLSVLEHFLEDINAGRPVCVARAWASIMAPHYENVVQESVDVYVSLMRQKIEGHGVLPLPGADLEKYHCESRALAKEHLLHNAPSSLKFTEPYLKALKERIRSEKNMLLGDNDILWARKVPSKVVTPVEDWRDLPPLQLKTEETTTTTKTRTRTTLVVARPIGSDALAGGEVGTKEVCASPTAEEELWERHRSEEVEMRKSTGGGLDSASRSVLHALENLSIGQAVVGQPNKINAAPLAKSGSINEQTANTFSMGGSTSSSPLSTSMPSQVEKKDASTSPDPTFAFDVNTYHGKEKLLEKDEEIARLKFELDLARRRRKSPDIEKEIAAARQEAEEHRDKKRCRGCLWGDWFGPRGQKRS